MSDFINYLQHRIEDTKRRLQEINDLMQKAATDREMLTGDLQGYERTLAAEMRDQGIPVAPKAIQDSLPMNGTGASASTSEPEVNKAEFCRQFIRGRAEIGATPADIFKGFQEAGVPITKPYIYSLVQRLQNQKPPAIKLRRGKWYPILESEQSMSGTAE